MTDYTIKNADVASGDSIRSRGSVAVHGARLARDSVAGPSFDLGGSSFIYPALINVHDHFRGNYLPRVSAFAQYGMTDRTVIPAVPRAGGDILTSGTDAVAGLNLSVNVFNGFRNSIDVQRAAIEERQAEIALEEEHLRLDAALREQLSQLRLREDALTLAGHNREAARAALELQVERFEAGSASSLEFRDAQLQFVRAATARINAQQGLRLAQLSLLRSIGEIVR